MALTLTTAPATRQFNNIVYFKVTSNTSGITKVICDVYLDSVYKLTVEKYPILGTTNVFEYDLSSVILGLFSSELATEIIANVPNGTVTPAPKSSKLISCKFYEVTTGNVTNWLPAGAGTANLTTTTYRLFHGQDFYENGSLSIARYNFGGANGIFSRKPKEVAQRYVVGNPLVISSYSTNATNVTGRYREYNASGNIINTVDTTLAQTNNKFYYTTALDTLTAGTSFVSLQLIAGTNQSERIDFKPVLNPCIDYVTLYWQNSIGGIDFFLFDGSVNFWNENKRSFYRKPANKDTSVFIGNEFELTTYNNVNTRYIDATTKVVGRDEALLLSDLAQGNGRGWIWDVERYAFIPVIIDDCKVNTISSDDGIYQASVKLLYSTNLKGGRF